MLLARTLAVCWGPCFVVAALTPTVIAVAGAHPELVHGPLLTAGAAAIASSAALHDWSWARAVVRFVASFLSTGAATAIAFVLMPDDYYSAAVWVASQVALVLSAMLASASLVVFLPTALLDRDTYPFLPGSSAPLWKRIAAVLAGALGAAFVYEYARAILGFDIMLSLSAVSLTSVLPACAGAAVVGALQHGRRPELADIDTGERTTE